MSKRDTVFLIILLVLVFCGGAIGGFVMDQLMGEDCVVQDNYADCV